MNPRPLTDQEKAILLLMLKSADETALLAQLPYVIVTRHWVGDLPSVDLSVNSEAPKADVPDGPMRVQGDVMDEEGEPIGLILLWVTNGALSAMEFAWYTDDPPHEWPETPRVALKS